MNPVSSNSNSATRSGGSGAVDVKRFDHFSLTVGDIDRSVAFYDRLGFQPVNRYTQAGPRVDLGAATANADMDIQLLRHGNDGPTLELIRYTRHPAGRSALNSEVGAAHIGLVVGDLRAAYDLLSADGVEFLSAPNTDQYGEMWVYLRDPDGIAVELMQPTPESARTRPDTNGDQR